MRLSISTLPGVRSIVWVKSIASENWLTFKGDLYGSRLYFQNDDSETWVTSGRAMHTPLRS